MNTSFFVALVAVAQVVIVLMAYSIGHANGWLRGWEERRDSLHS
jgi:hypothetical protein